MASFITLSSWLMKQVDICGGERAVPMTRAGMHPAKEILDTIQEAWIQYFDYPETVKMGLEGAHRSKKLQEYFQEHGIDFAPAPAEHHETIAQAERAIGVLCSKTDAAAITFGSALRDCKFFTRSRFEGCPKRR